MATEHQHPHDEKTPPPRRGGSFLGGILFGLVFGFLLQKGGVTHYNVLIGQLLLQDFTVAKVMLSAVVVGMVGIFVLNHLGHVNLHLKPTRPGRQSIGGLLFGVGFGLMAYCPGTGAAALGQGSWDFLFGAAGLVVGSYLFAVISGWLAETGATAGDRKASPIPDLLGIPRLPTALAVAALLGAGLYFLERTFPD